MTNVNPKDSKSPPLRDVDSAQQALHLQALAWSIVGAVIGGAFGAIVSMATQGSFAAFVVGGIVLGGLMVYLGVVGLGGLAGHGVACLLAPSGGTTPGPFEYSLAESFEARGRYDEAAAEYQKRADLAPLDPEARVRLARLYRDRLDRPLESLQWFRRARDVATDDEIEWQLVRELIELVKKHLDNPKQGLPDLARLASRQPGTSAGEWARREIAAIKRAGDFDASNQPHALTPTKDRSSS